jgi:hypothetical protein
MADAPQPGSANEVGWQPKLAYLSANAVVRDAFCAAWKVLVGAARNTNVRQRSRLCWVQRPGQTAKDGLLLHTLVVDACLTRVPPEGRTRSLTLSNHVLEFSWSRAG